MALSDEERQVIDWARQGADFALRLLENDPAQARPAAVELLALLRVCPGDQGAEILTSMVNLTGRLALHTDNVPQLKLWLRYGTSADNEEALARGLRRVASR